MFVCNNFRLFYRQKSYVKGKVHKEDKFEWTWGDRVTIIEGYANAGIRYLKSYVLNKGGSSVKNLLAYLNTQRNQEVNNGINDLVVLLLELS